MMYSLPPAPLPLWHSPSPHDYDSKNFVDANRGPTTFKSSSHHYPAMFPPAQTPLQPPIPPPPSHDDDDCHYYYLVDQTPPVPQQFPEDCWLPTTALYDSMSMGTMMFESPIEGTLGLYQDLLQVDDGTGMLWDGLGAWQPSSAASSCSSASTSTSIGFHTPVNSDQEEALPSAVCRKNVYSPFPVQKQWELLY